MARVVIEHVSKVFRGSHGEEIQAVQDVNLVVEAKELLVLVGPSGCGKTTLLRLLAGLEDATRGNISLDGRIINHVPPKDRDIAMVFQNHALYPHLTVAENLAFGLKLRRVPKAEIAARVQAAADLLGLAPYLDRLPKALSGGERQRVAVGRALVRRPQVFLFDEPLASLDAPLRAHMRAEIARLHERLGITMLYVTHDQVEALTLGQRVAVMNAGILQQVAAPRELYARPANRFVAGFIGWPPMNFFRGRLTAPPAAPAFVEAGPQGAAGFVLVLTDEQSALLRFWAGQSVLLGLRPEHLVPASDAVSLANGVRAVVELVEPLGAEEYLHLAVGAHRCIVRARPGEVVKEGQQMWLRFDLAHARYFNAETGQALG